MTKQELAVAVAEKVWGWTLEEDWIYDCGDGVHKFPTVHLEQEVFSWAGFGRTVEAMASRKSGITRGDVERFHSASDSYYCRFSTKEEYWERTHQAALSALESEVK